MCLWVMIAASANASSTCPAGDVFGAPIAVGADQPAPFACAVGDVNGDGIDDVAFLSIDARLRIKLGGPSLAGTSEYSFSVPRPTAVLKVTAPLAPFMVRTLVPCFVKVGVPVDTAIVLSVRSP